MNCKPGDLAYITHQSAAAPNLGRIVEVIEARPARNGWALWLVTSVAPMNGIDPETGKPATTQRGVIPDAWLRPISGVPVTDDVTDEAVA